MNKTEAYEKEKAKLNKIFEVVEDEKRKLAEGLIDDAAFLYSENDQLKDMMEETGMVKVHPNNPNLQKPTEAAKQYLKNVNSYAVVIKALASVLNKADFDEDEGLGDYE